MTTLYKIDSLGNTRVWNCNVVDNMVFITHGLLDGQLISESWECYPKNVGRSNETTAIQQAELEAQSAIDAKLRLGYYNSIAEAKKHSDKFKAMKLYKAIELDDDGNMYFTKHFEKLPDQVILQLKYNGVWCAVSLDENDELYFMSRGNTEYSYLRESKIAEELKQVLPKGVIVIGEVFNHKYQESQVAGLVKRTKNFDDESDAMLNTLRFVIYDVYFAEDILNEWNYIQKLDYIKNFTGFTRRTTDKGKAVFPVAWKYYNKSDILSALEQVRSKGFEGLVIRDPNCVYEPGKRSQQVLKVKAFDTTDYVIRDITLSDKGITLFHFDGFTATLNADKVEQERYFWHKDQYIDTHVASIRHDGFTAYDVPKFPKIVEIVPKDVKDYD